MSVHECGAEIAAGALICFGCGLEIVAAATAVTAAPSSTSPTPAVTTADCAGCGRPLANAADVCVFCGGTAAVTVVDAGARVVLPDGREVAVGSALVIGRMSASAVVASALDFDGVSRRHALLSDEGDGLFVRDLGSTNGTWLEDTPVEGERRVPPGRTTLRLGARIEITIVNGAAG
ncbi:FHA domain-containing protein [Microbacterium sp. ARD32]|uniref:FHA domain-containing protein n=1 Tax=Microbacterium sp. ARD32 TaxID=2962577 RepID=UPI0028815FD3|nr:FHA domain-containing protein [Microbacterium sp. ARD32]MDT0158200.1 FHA domain-containing protein [Microbacterium sp. ARD32]